MGAIDFSRIDAYEALTSTGVRSCARYLGSQILAEVICDSVAPNGVRLTTFKIRYQRFIHAEFMTHRLFSRNAASSRAIPVKKMRARARSNPAMPVFWGANKAGMQADYEVTGWRLWAAKAIWRLTGIGVSLACALLDLLGLHKQIANRMLEPWFCIETVVTATDWGNWDNLRTDSAAQPEIQALAACMLVARERSIPRQLQEGEYHLPFVTFDEEVQLRLDQQIQCSVARCARATHLNHDNSDPSWEKDAELYQKLLTGSQLGNKHVSPFEHVATPAETAETRSGNFRGWHQWRKQIPGEYRPDFDTKGFLEKLRTGALEVR